MQLLHLKPTSHPSYLETYLLNFFTFILNATDEIPESHLYTPLYVFSRFYLIVENWHQTAQELIQSLRHNTKQKKIQFLHILSDKNNHIQVIDLARCFGPQV